MGRSGGLTPRTGIWTQTFFTSFPLTLILFGCSAPPRYSLIHFLLVTNPPSSTFFLPSQEESLLQPTHTAPSPSHIFLASGFLGNLGMRWMLWGSEASVQEICTISVIPGIPLPPASIQPPAYNRFLYSMMTLENIAVCKYRKTSVDIFFAEKQILTWSLCCVATCSKILSNFPESFFLITTGASFRSRDNVDSQKVQ